MSATRSVVAGFVAGAIGAAIWAGIAYYANMEIGYVAWGIGALVGFAVAVGGNTAGPAAGVTAVLITIVSLLAGKYATVELLIQKDLHSADGVMGAPEEFKDSALISHLARGVVERREAAGQTVVMPKVDFENFDRDPKYDFPRDVWAQATREFQAMSPEENQQMREEMAEASRVMMAALQEAFLNETREQGFLASFTPYDLLFFGLAIFTAWGVANNGGQE